MRYYNTDRIRAIDAHYNFIIGERSNGKTTAVLRDIIRDFHERGKSGAVIRQQEVDIQGHKGASLFNAVVAGGMVAELTDDEWTGVAYKSRAYHLTRYDEDGKLVTQADPFCRIFAITQAGHYKGNSYPNIGTILFDEFISISQRYLVDEVSQFLNVVSTLVREKDEAKIFMVANTVSWNSPYFKAFGLKDVSRMKPGQLATVDYRRPRRTGADLVMKVALEYCESTAEYGGKPSDVYFVVDDERVGMITDGTFAIPNYPTCPHSFNSSHVRLTYWLETEDRIIRCRLLKVSRRDVFVFAETVDAERMERYADPRRDLFYSLDFSSSRNHFIDPARPYHDSRTRWLADAIATGRIFFDDNETGEDFNYYLNQAAQRSIRAL